MIINKLQRHIFNKRKHFSDALYDMFDTYFKGNPEAKVFDPFGCEEFTFAREDLYYENGERKNPLVLAWMLKTKRLSSNVGTNNNDMFDSPFIYTDGVVAPEPTVELTQNNRQVIEKAKEIDLAQDGGSVYDQLVAHAKKNGHSHTQ